MKPLLVVLPYHAGDFELAKKLITWIAELGSCEPHSLLLCADSKVPQAQMRELMDIARPSFIRVNTMIVTVPTATNDQRVWAPNVMFLNAARQVNETTKFDFLWLEPDCVPMHEGWLNRLADEWAECPDRFMGTIVEQNSQPDMPAKYLNGVAIYSNNAIEVFEKIQSVKDSSQAFDIGAAAALVPRSVNTPMIMHYWGTKELPPVFVEARMPDSPKNHVTLDFVRPDVALFHRSKDGKLIDLLRAYHAKQLEELKKLPVKIVEVPMTATVQNPDGTISKAPETTPEAPKPTAPAPTPARTPAANRRQTQPA